MPLSGIGVAPSGALFNELTAVNRRAFVPQLIVQLYFACPTLFYLIGNQQKAAGGLNQVTVPLQGQSMVQGGFTGYGGGFNAPNIIPAIQNGQWNLAYWVVPVPVPFGETVIQGSDRVISVLKARMNDVYAVTRQKMSTIAFTNNSSNPLFPDSLFSAFDNGTNVPSYGGVNRLAAGNTFFQGQYINLAAAPWSLGSSGFTRAKMQALLAYTADNAGGEKVTAVIMNPSDHATLNNDFVGVEQYNPAPGKEYNADTAVRSSFPNLNVSSVPIFADHFCPKGSIFGFNVKYTCMYISEDANFDFSGFQPLTILNQIGQQGIVVTGYDIISVKPVSGFIGYGLGGGSF